LPAQILYYIGNDINSYVQIKLVVKATHPIKIPTRGLSEERREQLMAALAQLPERQRMVFMLSHFDGRSSREVSGMTGLNESTVRVHLFRAIRRLRVLLAGGAAEKAIRGRSNRRSSRAVR
jgi:DNA-directed RNA polymerase specialized sigma24 family protein